MRERTRLKTSCRGRAQRTAADAVHQRADRALPVPFRIGAPRRGGNRHERPRRVRAHPGGVVRRHARRHRWPGASALIDEACGLTGNGLVVAEGPKDDIRVLFVGGYWRGQRREDLEREYLKNYHPTDERIPRLRQLPDSHLVHVKELYTAEELKTSPTYNELLCRAACRTA